MLTIVQKYGTVDKPIVVYSENYGISIYEGKKNHDILPKTAMVLWKKLWYYGKNMIQYRKVWNFDLIRKKLRYCRKLWFTNGY